MKKTETVEKYYCDYCGNECKNTSNYIMPALEPHTEYAMNKGVKLFATSRMELTKKEVDICPDCQEKIASLISLLPKMDFDEFGQVTIKFQQQ